METNVEPSNLLHPGRDEPKFDAWQAARFMENSVFDSNFAPVVSREVGMDFTLTSPPVGRKRRSLLGAMTVWAAFTGGLLWLTHLQAEEVRDDLFSRRILPLLRGHCLKCHNPADKQGGLDLTTQRTAVMGGESGSVIDTSQPDESLLLQKVRDEEMPPDEKLTPQEIADLTTWIKLGATYPEDIKFEIKRAGKDFWTLQKPVRAELPAVQEPRFQHSPIDRFVAAELERAGLTASSETDRRSYLRRVKFDLLGLPATPEELSTFEADTSPQAYEHLVDKLLNSPHYGERWGRHWLDVVRFGESHGYETNQLRMNAWPYRDYVIRSFNEDKPYPQFILEQLAGDQTGKGNPQIEVATAYLVGGTHDVVGNQTVEGKLKQRNDDLDDMISTTGFAFLGLTIGCARCHDHKFDPISQKDYYGLQAIFAGVQHAERTMGSVDSPDRQQAAAMIDRQLSALERELDQLEPLANVNPKEDSSRRPPVQARRNVERFAPITARFVRLKIIETFDQSQPCVDELEIYTSEEIPRNVALASQGTRVLASSSFPGNPIHQLGHVHDGAVGNSHSWISNEAGKGWLQFELTNPYKIDRIVWGRDREEKFKDRLASVYVLEVAEQPDQWTVVATSQDRLRPGASTASQPMVSAATQNLFLQRAQLASQLAELRRPLTVYAGTFQQPGPTHLLQRGDGLLPGPEVYPSTVRAFGGDLFDKNMPEAERRLALARWIGSRGNPLTARVLVNRVWHYHFGQGLVNTPNDFGYNGSRPSHPALLDWLAVEFMENGWRLKPLQKQIVLSSTYRQSTHARPDCQQIDAGNRLLWRYPPRRLEAEIIRDSILSVTGKLDTRMGGPGYNIWEKNTNYVVVFKYKMELGTDEFRRMIYQFKPRAQQDQTFGAFDCPDASFSMPRRFTSTTAIQALNMFNGGFLLKQAEYFAQRLQQDVPTTDDQRIRRGFQLCYLRDPTPTELAGALHLVQTHGLSALCRALLNSNELIYLDD